MQGSYNNNGLPRPYYMKPSKKKSSPYDGLSASYFTTPTRKIVGYLVMLGLFGLCVFWIGQLLRSTPDIEYELDLGAGGKGSKLPIDNIADVVNNDKDSSNIGLAGNMAVGSKGDVGRGVNEAPKGGIANEAPVVGNDEGQVVGGKKKVPAKMDFEEQIVAGNPQEVS